MDPLERFNNKIGREVRQYLLQIKEIIRGATNAETSAARVDRKDRTFGTLKENLDANLFEMDDEVKKVNEQLAKTKTKVDAIDRGIGGTYASLSAIQATFPSGDTRRFVAADNGHWYWWNGIEWISGGVFQATVPPNEMAFRATNLMINGDFAQGITGYDVVGATTEVASSILTLTGTGTNGLFGMYNAPNYRYTGKANHKVYMRARVRVRDPQCVGIKLYANNGAVNADLDGNEYSVRNPLVDVWYPISGIIDSPAAWEGGSIRHFIYVAFSSASVAAGKRFDIFKPLAINLTEIFGVGNEPTAKEVDELLNQFPDRYFNGVADLQSVKQYMHTLNKKLKTEINTIHDDRKKTRYKYDLQDDFTTVWTPDATGKISVTNTTEKVLTGDTSLKITVANSQHNIHTVDRVTNFSLKDKSKQMMVKLWVEKPKDLATILIYFGNEETTWTNYGYMQLLGNGEGDASQSGGLIRKGWNYLPIIPSAMVNAGNFSWDNPIKRMRISINSRIVEPLHIIFDSFWVNGVGKPKIVFTFDDGWKTVIENAYQKMKENGIVGTTYVNGQYVSNPENPLSPNYMELTQLKELYANKWCIANHAWAHEIYFLQNRTVTNYIDAINKNRDWILDNKMGEGAIHYAYTNGEYDEHVISMLKAHGYKSARSAKPRGHHPILIDKPYEIISRAFNSTVTLDTAKKWVDYTIETGGTTFFQFHQIAIDDTSTVSPNVPALSWSKAKFDGLIDYIVSKGLANNCVTHDQWYEDSVREGLIELQ